MPPLGNAERNKQSERQSKNENNSGKHRTQMRNRYGHAH